MGFQAEILRMPLFGKLINHLPGNGIFLLGPIELKDGILWPTLNDNLTSLTVLFHRRRGDEDHLRFALQQDSHEQSSPLIVVRYTINCVYGRIRSVRSSWGQSNRLVQVSVFKRMHG